MLKNLFRIYLFIFLFVFIFVFSVFVFYKILEKDRKKIIENKEYGFDLEINKNLYYVGKEDFIRISNQNIGKNLLKNQCILNISTEKISENICDYFKNECTELNCKNYVCEKHYKDWYKIIQYGDFFGTGDGFLAYKNGDFLYALNLECEIKKDDNLDNPLLSLVVGGMLIK